MQDVDNLENAGLSARDSRLELVHNIAHAEDVSAAALALESHLETFDAHLLSVKFCDTTDPGTVIRPFCTYPDAAIAVSQQIQVQGGCPFTKEAMHRLSAFDSCNIDRSQYATFLDRRFFAEIDKAGHRHIAIVPVLLGRALALFTIGLGERPFKGHMREMIVEAIGQAMPAFIERFQGIKTIFEKKHLSDLERQIVQLLFEGSRPSDIQSTIGFSELTISLLISNASHKLQAKNSQSLIYKALALGEISQMPAIHSVGPSRELH